MHCRSFAARSHVTLMQKLWDIMLTIPGMELRVCKKLAGKPLKEKTVQKTKIYGFLQNYMYMYDCLKNSVINPSTNLDQWVLGLNIPSMNESQTHSMIPLLNYIIVMNGKVHQNTLYALKRLEKLDISRVLPLPQWFKSDRSRGSTLKMSGFSSIF